MINDIFQVVSYSYEPRRPRYQNKIEETDKLRDIQGDASAFVPPGSHEMSVTKLSDHDIKSGSPVSAETENRTPSQSHYNEEKIPAKNLIVSDETAGMQLEAANDKIRHILEENKETIKQNIPLAMSAYGRSEYGIGSTVNRVV